jgi:hypothetical protein
MRYTWTAPRPIITAAAGTLGLLGVGAAAVLVWAGRDHGTNCQEYGEGAARDAGPYLHPVFVGCYLAALLLVALLLLLSARGRSERLGTSVGPGRAAVMLSAIAGWCAAVYLPIAADWHTPANPGLLVKAIAVPPFVLLVGIVWLIAVVQYALFVPLPLLVGVALTRRSQTSAYRWMEAAVVYALIGCIALAVGASVLIAGFCFG